MVATKTKPRKAQFIPGGGPFKQKLKGRAAETQAEYEQRATQVLRAIMRGEAEKLQQADYVKLQAGLRKLGVEITPEALENKISRGTFSTAFLIQCMDTLGIDSVTVAK